MTISVKKVNIMPRRPITIITPPIRMPIYNVTKKVNDIKLAILAGARVEELMPDGSKVLLNLNNYDVDNTNTMKVKPVEDNEEKPIEDIIKEAEEEVKNEKKKEEPKEEPKEEVQPKSTENTNMENLSRKQRRALEAEKRKEASENVVVKNPEDGNV